MVFNAYAAYYNLLYKDKDYNGEALYIHQLIQARNASAKSVLDLGCGTGKHAAEFVKLGYEVTGVDLSEDMVSQAKAAKIPNTAFYQGDLRSFERDEKFDVVVSLFHVLSYQTTNEALEAAFQTAKKHLKPDGVFIFDFWYGPSVLMDQPTVRIKRMSDAHCEVLRLTEPVMHYNENMVDVHFDVQVKHKSTGKVEYITEKHEMRYFFQPELAFMLSQLGFKNINLLGWLKNEAPTKNDWNAILVMSGELRGER